MLKRFETLKAHASRNRLDDLNTHGLPKAEGDVFALIKDLDFKYGAILDAISNSTTMNTLDSRDSELKKALGDEASRDIYTIEGLSDKMGSLVQSQMATRFKQVIQARLKFSDMPDRFERIDQAHEATFNWVFNPPELQSDDVSWDNFSKWLSATDQSRIYWITGMNSILVSIHSE